MTAAFSVNSLIGAPTTIVVHILEFFTSRAFSDFLLTTVKLIEGGVAKRKVLLKTTFFR